jgi:predicted Zn-dependent peptidase
VTVRRVVLDTGLTLLVDPMREVRSVAVGLFVRAGSAAEPPARRGLSHFLEHVLFKRTRRRSHGAISRAIDGLGGDVDAFTTKEYTGFYAHVLDGRFEEALDLLADIVLAPAFRSPDVETERGVILEEIGEASDNPDDLVHETLVRRLWSGHPLGAPILGTERSVRSIGIADLYRWHGQAYVPANLIVSIAGRVSAATAARAVERRLARLSRAGKLPRRRQGAPRAHPNVALTVRPGLEQTHVCLGFPAPSQTSGRRFATHLLDVVIGGGMSSRLHQEVREKRGLAYSISSSWNAYRSSGYEAIHAACAPKNLERLIAVMVSQLARLKRRGVRPGELSWARSILESGLQLGLESTVSRMLSQARQEFYFGRVEPPAELIARLKAVSADAVGEEAGRLLAGRSLCLSVVGSSGELPMTAEGLASAL